jgi:hypothetical protein
MNTFKKKSLYAALAGISALGAAGAAQAVNVNPGGLGQVLLYPYYTTRPDNLLDPYNSLLSVVNSTASVKAVKVRFVEGKNSREVLDFNLFLSPFDVWTAAIIPDAGGGARMTTQDKSCTIPKIPAAGVPFVNFAYSGSNDDGGGNTLDRTKEGYVEIIEMATYSSSSTIAAEVTHASGVPPCGSNLTDNNASNEAQFPQGGLFGGLSLINVLSGTDYTEDAVALDNYSRSEIYAASGSISPDLSQAFPPVSQVLANGAVYTSTWLPGPSPAATTSPTVAANVDPVSAVLMHDQVMNEFVLDTGTKSGTDWVLTFPTKKFYINIGTGTAPKLFQRNFNKTAGACDDVSLGIFDREEFTAPTSFSPPPPSQTNALCWEANVLTFNNSHLLGSANETNIPTAFQNGWLNLGFPLVTAAPNAHLLRNVAGTTITFIGGGVSSNASVTYYGLPVIGFAVQDFVNGAVPGGGVAFVQSSYGGNFVQKTTTNVQ